MDKRILRLLMTALLAGMLSPAPGQNRRFNTSGDERAVIVVTGLRVHEDQQSETKDLTVAEGAMVKLTAKTGESWEKKTEPFSRGSGKDAWLTADFPVALDTEYEIVMTFKDGTVIRIEHYRLPADWQTHFFYHSTRGTLSPSSVLRTVQDPRTGLRCAVYALWPVENYKKMGGRQVE